MRRRSAHAGGVLLGLALLAASCYQPDFRSAIYRCDGYLCPSGLVCSSDGYCVSFPVDGCINGGISAGNNAYLCPGLKNGCQAEFQACFNPPTELACPARTDAGVGIACKVCCPK